MFFLALTPILIILVLMVGLRWGAARAGALGYINKRESIDHVVDAVGRVLDGEVRARSEGAE